MTLENLNLETIIEELKKAYNNDGRSFKSFRYNEIKYVILSHLHTSKSVSRIGRERLVDSVLRRFYKEDISVVNFESFFEESKKKYFEKREVKYTLLTSLSIDYLPFRKIEVNNSIIKIHGKKFPRHFLKKRDEVLKASRKEENNKDYLKVSVTLKGKSYYDAFEKAYFDLNVFRAILCLNLNSYSEIPMTNDSHRGINKIQFGEFHTLHFSETGESVEKKGYWFETNIANQTTQFPIQKKKLQKDNINYWLRNLNKCSKTHRDKLSEVLNLYVSAFDEKDKQTCFLKGWIALENLLGTHDNKLIVKRCSAIYKIKDRAFQNEILEGLRIQRNQLVHENDSKTNSIVNCYHVQRFIKGILLFNNLRYSNIIKNSEEALKLLDYRLQPIKRLESELKVITEIKKIKKFEN